MTIEYNADDRGLMAEEFIALFSIFRHHETLDPVLLQDALRRTVNVTARADGLLVGCVRLVSDGYLMTAVAEAMVHPDYTVPVYPAPSIYSELMRLVDEVSPTGLWFGVQKLDDETMRILGWYRGPITYYKRKPLRTTPWER